MTYLEFLTYLNDIGVPSLSKPPGEICTVDVLISLYSNEESDDTLSPEHKSRFFPTFLKTLSDTNKCAVCQHADTIAFSSGGGSLTFCQARNNACVSDNVEFCLKFLPIKMKIDV